MSSRHLFVAVLAMAPLACNDLGLSAEPEELTVQVDASDTDQVALITSTNWIYAQDPACPDPTQGCPEVLRVLSADTTVVTAPHERRLRFNNDYRYFVAVYPATGQTATLRMRIRIDGKDWFDEARQLSPSGANGEQETLQFVYQWRRPRL